RAAEQYAEEYPDRTVDLVPIVAAENDYFTKNELLMSSPRTSPDVVYEDTFILMSDVAAGYLQPIDQFVEQWEHWDDVAEASQEAVSDEEGQVYGIPASTDTRALWYDKRIFEEAGLPEEWEPQTWEEVLDAARMIKEQVEDVTPMFIFSGMPQGEKATMQGFQMLFYGTGETLYDEDTQKWVIGSQAYIDTLTFLKTMFDEDLTLTLGQNLDPNINETIYTSLIPDGKLGILLDGSWISQNWVEGGTRPWPEWPDIMGLAPMPTQEGQDPGSVTLAGGWCWTIPEHASDPEISFSFIEALTTTENMVQRAVEDNNITVRYDVAETEEYRTYSPTTEFFTDMLETAYYRPAFSAYPEISSAIQESMELVMTGSMTPEQAAANYDNAVIDIVGEDETESRS
ncbi:MAG: extracellular solute-binding protein, partial [Brachybacterium sp.]|nr:extracellular solute-binding protein [Brachybacterium sp.]